jgi:hypothetical protein
MMLFVYIGYSLVVFCVLVYDMYRKGQNVGITDLILIFGLSFVPGVNVVPAFFALVEAWKWLQDNDKVLIKGKKTK